MENVFDNDILTKIIQQSDGDKNLSWNGHYSKNADFKNYKTIIEFYDLKDNGKDVTVDLNTPTNTDDNGDTPPDDEEFN